MKRSRAEIPPGCVVLISSIISGRRTMRADNLARRYRDLLFATISILAFSLILPARADDNFSNIMQSGSDNDGVLVQGPGDHNSFGTAPDAATQQGARNSFDVLQQGNRNAIGGEGAGFEQAGNRNTATITQASNRNGIGELLQVDETGSSANVRNTLTVLQQGGAANTIGSIRQTRTDGGFFANLGAGNSATLTQGSPAAGGGNGVTTFSQSGRANTASLSQSSANNTVDTFSQDGTGNSATFSQRGGNGNVAHTVSQNGAQNVIGLTFDGARNGADNFAPVLVGSSAFSGFTQGNTMQDGRGNHIDSFTVTGNRNAYAFAQRSFFVGNTIDGYVQGDANQFAVHQNGEANGAHLGVAAGNRNEIVISQDGVTVLGVSTGVANDGSVTIGGDRNGVMVDQFGIGNEAAATIDGNLNLLAATQDGVGNRATVVFAGNRNDVTLDQMSLGNGNIADIDVRGNANFADISQSGLFGVANSLTLAIHGDRNNAPVLGGFSGPAGSVAASAGLMPGSIVQSGSGNTIAMAVGTTTLSANANMFAFSQNGSGNAIAGSIVGNGNQAAVIQAGNGNITSFSQVGNDNVIGISQ